MNIEVKSYRPSGSIHRTGMIRGDVRKAHDEGKAWWESKVNTLPAKRQVLNMHGNIVFKTIE